MKLKLVFAAALSAATVIASASSASAQCGTASWYGPGFHGQRTANGEKFNMGAMTAAHKTMAFGTKLRVTNKRNGRSVVVRINDRGPYAGGRMLDLSKAAANQIGMIKAGSGAVCVQKV